MLLQRIPWFLLVVMWKYFLKIQPIQFGRIRQNDSAEFGKTIRPNSADFLLISSAELNSAEKFGILDDTQSYCTRYMSYIESRCDGRERLKCQ